MSHKSIPLFVLAATALLFAGCTSQQKVTYALSFDVTDPTLQQQLTLASMRVIQRRVAHLGDTLVDQETDTKNNQTTITVTLGSKQGADGLTSELTEPFKLRIMAQVQGTQKPDITVDGQGSFVETGITEKDMQWVDASEDTQNNTGVVRLDFTPAGKTKMQALFKQMKGKDIGLFVRDKLVSKLHVETDTLPDDVVIRDVPSADIAGIFADDMDVGLHVTFTPVP